MTLSDLIELFDSQRGGSLITDSFAREIVKTLRAVDEERTHRTSRQPPPQRAPQ